MNNTDAAQLAFAVFNLIGELSTLQGTGTDSSRARKDQRAPLREAGALKEAAVRLAQRVARRAKKRRSRLTFVGLEIVIAVGEEPLYYWGFSVG